MIDGYKKTQDGVIEQTNKGDFVYDIEYAKRYSYFNNKSIENLRLGYIIGTLGHVPNSLLDVGYGNGEFLNHCKNFIPNLYGYDIEPSYPLDEGIDFVKDFKSKQVEVITFFDCLEHFHDIEFVSELQCQYLVISLPWCYSCDDDEWFKNWKHRKPNEHIFHFDEVSLQSFMKRMGYTLINFCNLEDKIRIDKNLSPNILTATFKKNVY